MSQSYYYQSKPEDWPGVDRKTGCDKLQHYISDVMKLPIAKDFIVFHNDHDTSPIVAYSVDLWTIKDRLKNRFYHRVTSLKFDIKCLEKNTEKSNDQDARLLVKLCLNIVEMMAKDVDVNDLYKRCRSSHNAQASATIKTQETMKTSVKTDKPHKKSTASTKRLPGKIEKKYSSNKSGWSRRQCRKVLKTLWDTDDFAPFQFPVNEEEYSDYKKYVTTPWCFNDIMEQFEESDLSPKQVNDELERIVSNSRNYNTNKESEIYEKTTRLSDKIKELMAPFLKRRSSRVNKRPASSPIEGTSKKLMANKTFHSLDGISNSQQDQIPSTSSAEQE